MYQWILKCGWPISNLYKYPTEHMYLICCTLIFARKILNGDKQKCKSVVGILTKTCWDQRHTLSATFSHQTILIICDRSHEMVHNPFFYFWNICTAWKKRKSSFIWYHKKRFNRKVERIVAKWITGRVIVSQLSSGSIFCFSPECVSATYVAFCQNESLLNTQGLFAAWIMDSLTDLSELPV